MNKMLKNELEGETIMSDHITTNNSTSIDEEGTKLESSEWNTENLEQFYVVDKNENPWDVESIQEFSCLKCPECLFFSKDELLFQDHATENHPWSNVLFEKVPKLEGMKDPIIKEECQGK